MKRSFILVLVILMASISFGCGSKSSNLEVPLKIGVLPIEDNLPFYVAEQDGLFKKEGLNVELIPFDSAAERDAALMAGQIDGEAADIVAAALLKKSGNDVKIGSIALGVTPQEGRFALLVAPESAVESVQDIKNITIGISENTIIEYVTDQIIKDFGVNEEKVDKVAIPKMPVRMQMLLSGKIDAALLPEPLATLAEFQGAKVIADDTYANVSQVVLLFSTKAIEAKGEAIRELIKVYGEAGESLTQEPEEYRGIFLEKARVPKPIQDIYNSPTFSAPQLPKEEDVMRVLNWMVEKGLLDKPFEYQEMVDATLVKS